MDTDVGQIVVDQRLYQRRKIELAELQLKHTKEMARGERYTRVWEVALKLKSQNPEMSMETAFMTADLSWQTSVMPTD